MGKGKKSMRKFAKQGGVKKAIELPIYRVDLAMRMIDGGEAVDGLLQEHIPIAPETSA